MDQSLRESIISVIFIQFNRNQDQLKSTGTVWQDANVFSTMPKSEEYSFEIALQSNLTCKA